MDFQNIIVILIIGAASIYVGRLLWRKIKFTNADSACETGCGCGSKSKNALTQNARKIKSKI